MAADLDSKLTPGPCLGCLKACDTFVAIEGTPEFHAAWLVAQLNILTDEAFERLASQRPLQSPLRPFDSPAAPFMAYHRLCRSCCPLAEPVSRMGTLPTYREPNRGATNGATGGTTGSR